MLSLFVLTLFVGASWAEHKMVCSRVDGKPDLECVVVGDFEMPNLIGGDMIVPDDQTDEEFGRNAALSRHWPGGQIPYAFHQSMSADEEQTVLKAMNAIMNETCVRFVPWSDSGPVLIVTNEKEGCFSNVGMTLNNKGQSFLNLQTPNCSQFGIAVHELLHVTGLLHEQSRPDRDDFVDIIWSNIQTEAKRNFVKAPETLVTTFGLPYDYQSILHYNNNAFAIQPESPTIVHKTKPSEQFGQRVAPTFNDLEKVRRMYKC